MECSLSMALKGPTFENKREKKEFKILWKLKTVIIQRNSKCYKYNLYNFHLNKWIFSPFYEQKHLDDRLF